MKNQGTPKVLNRPILKAHYKIAKVAALTDIGIRYWKERVKEGSITGYMLGGDFVIEAASLIKFLDKQKVKSPEELEQMFSN